MKIYGIINGLFWIFYGLYGMFMPAHLAKYVTGWTPDLLGLHQIRATWTAFFGIGIVCLLLAMRGNLRHLTKAIVVLTLCFTAGRILSLAMDGAGPIQTYYEIGVEITSAIIGAVLLMRDKSRSTKL